MWPENENINNSESCSLSLAVSVGYEFRRRRKSLAPPQAEFCSERQSDLVRSSRKSDGGAAEGLQSHTAVNINLLVHSCCYAAFSC